MFVAFPSGTFQSAFFSLNLGDVWGGVVLFLVFYKRYVQVFRCCRRFYHSIYVILCLVHLRSSTCPSADVQPFPLSPKCPESKECCLPWSNMAL